MGHREGDLLATGRGEGGVARCEIYRLHDVKPGRYFYDPLKIIDHRRLVGLQSDGRDNPFWIQNVLMG